MDIADNVHLGNNKEGKSYGKEINLRGHEKDTQNNLEAEVSYGFSEKQAGQIPTTSRLQPYGRFKELGCMSVTVSEIFLHGGAHRYWIDIVSISIR